MSAVLGMTLKQIVLAKLADTIRNGVANWKPKWKVSKWVRGLIVKDDHLDTVIERVRENAGCGPDSPAEAGNKPERGAEGVPGYEHDA